MKHKISTVALLLAFCLSLTAFPSAALAGEFFPRYNYRYTEVTDEAQALYDELVAKVGAIKDRAKHSSSNMKEISAWVEKIEKIESKTSWIASAAKHQKAIALKKYRRYSDAIKIWESLTKQWQKDKNWDALFETYLCIGDAHMLSGSSKKAHEAYTSASAVEEEAKLSLAAAAKKEIEGKIAAAKPQPSGKATKLDPITIFVWGTAYISVSGAASVTYSSSDSSVAKVDGAGTITGLKTGKATITVNIDDNLYSCLITVKKAKQVDMKDIAAEVLKLVNNEREKAGVSKVSLDDTLMEAASIRAQECIVLFSSTHTRPDGTPASTVMKDVGLDRGSPAYFGENIARGIAYKTPQQVVEAWMNSPGHRRNILNKGSTKMGIGLAYDDNGVPRWSQIFTS